MKSIIFLLLIFSAELSAQGPVSSAVLSELAETERNFAKTSMMYGRNKAFVMFFARKCIIFTDKWITSGKQFSKKRKQAPTMLKWEPEFIDMAASLDFGISTGPWELHEYRPGTAPVATGYYLSVWEKQKSNEWKVILDAGTSTPPLSRYSHELVLPVDDGNVPISTNPDAEKVDLINAENAFINAWVDDPDPGSYFSYLAKDVIIFRNNYPPLVNPDRGNLTGNTEKKYLWQQEGCREANSRDLGFTYGILKSRSDGSIAGHYVRIWKNEKDRGWRISADMMNLD